VALRSVAPGDTASYGATWRADRPVTLATVSAGYEDGVMRALSNRGKIQIGEALCPVAGRVTMDMTVLDVGESRVAIGDVATIWGDKVTLDEQASAAGTISYELLTSLGGRVVRRYLNGA
jgi:alanine racemase